MLQVGVAAYSGQPTPSLLEACRMFVRSLTSRCKDRVALVVGGYWGLMKCVVDEAVREGLTVVIVPPVDREDAGYPEEAVVMSTGCDPRCRSVALVRSSHVLVALGGAVGTLIEVLLAYSYGKPVYILGGTGLDTDRYRGVLEPHADHRGLARVEYVEDPVEIAEKACSAARR